MAATRRTTHAGRAKSTSPTLSTRRTTRSQTALSTRPVTRSQSTSSPHLPPAHHHPQQPMEPPSTRSNPRSSRITKKPAAPRPLSRPETPIIAPTTTPSPPSRVINDLLEERTHPSKGRAVYTRKPIRAGTRLLSETPLIQYSGSTKQKARTAAIKARYRALPAPRKAQLDRLAGHAGWPGVISKFNLNAYQHDRQRSGAADVADAAYDEDDTVVCQILYAEISMINHSCRPNSFPAFNDRIARGTVHAMCDLGAGVEVTVDYGGGEIRLSEERREHMREWGFECACELCEESGSMAAVHAIGCESIGVVEANKRVPGKGASAPSRGRKPARQLPKSPVWSASDRRRHRMKGRWADIRGFFQELKTNHRTMKDDERLPSIQTKLIEVMEDAVVEGYLSMSQLGDMLTTGALIQEKCADDAESACLLWEQYHKLALICVGDDHNEVIRAKANMQRLQERRSKRDNTRRTKKR
ncbi:SET domain-containing protein [Pseudovirgaria hyperparasitica]|uniref:SET domain-containing protein n=1 Tax=Pseudovirgaria hyperparasitica TaxID=470096 RepID=A0A6A6W3T3_9PEZI|nr:SET domain-containing protein [Pseudovirgaria hyperparasitica]KAF2756684.1 SET domain-containing protein [Pseudovirgaria hyperparasitica]